MKHMLAGRNIPSMNCIGVENPDKDRSSEFKKSEKVKKNKNENLIGSYFSGLATQKTFSLSF